MYSDSISMGYYIFSVFRAFDTLPVIHLQSALICHISWPILIRLSNLFVLDSDVHELSYVVSHVVLQPPAIINKAKQKTAIYSHSVSCFKKLSYRQQSS